MVTKIEKLTRLSFAICAVCFVSGFSSGLSLTGGMVLTACLMVPAYLLFRFETWQAS